ncbi:MAG: Gfo/Idh/MocA family oxidoreductase [Acidobacteriota bacterium]|nr:Gfo/Idh/MocA family oxidoreductase [Acidobacteriota bacterium]
MNLKAEISSSSGALSPIRVGFIGAGSVLWAYLGVLDRLVARGYCLEGPICARRPETWPGLLSRRPGMKLVTDPRAVVESNVHVVVIITPPESHSELARLALEHGKHLVVEKPMALSPSGAEELAQLADRRGLFLLAAPFVHLAPTFRALWGFIHEGAIGRVHSARGLYGNAGSRVLWHHKSGEGPLSEKGIYNLKSLTALLGPVAEVLSAEATAVAPRVIGNAVINNPDPDVSHVILRHESGALSSIVSSNAIQRYRRPGLELYGTEGTANLLGDDWDPRGVEIWRNEAGRWEEYEPIESTWHWADGLRELVMALVEGRAPLADIGHDIHLLEIIEAARRAAREGSAVAVTSRFRPLDLRLRDQESRHLRHQVHDHTRPEDEQ